MSDTNIRENDEELEVFEETINEEEGASTTSGKKRKVVGIWLFSGLLHLIAVCALALVIIKTAEKKEDIIVTTSVIPLKEDEIEEVKEITVIKVKSEVKVEETSDVPFQTVTITDEKPSDHVETANNMNSESAEGVPDAISDSPSTGSGLMGNIGGGGGGGGAFGQRTGGGKKRAIMKNGGSKKTESAVDLGLMWLANHQENDGSWNCGKYEGEANEQYDVATTGAALLAFLGAGYNDKVGKYKNNVKKGLEFMISKQKNSGAFFHDGANNYTNGMCTMALAEAIGLGCGVPAWKKNLESAVDNILKQQIPGAGWTYFNG